MYLKPVKIKQLLFWISVSFWVKLAHSDSLVTSSEQATAPHAIPIPAETPLSDSASNATSSPSSSPVSPGNAPFVTGTSTIDPAMMAGIARLDRSTPASSIVVRLVKEMVEDKFQNLVGISVELWEVHHPLQKQSAQTGADGRVTFANLSPGDYQAQAQVFGRKQSTEVIQITPNQEGGFRVLLYFPEKTDSLSSNKESQNIKTTKENITSESTQTNQNSKNSQENTNQTGEGKKGENEIQPDQNKTDLPAKVSSLYFAMGSRIEMVASEEFIFFTETWLIENPTASPVFISASPLLHAELFLPLPKEAESIQIQDEDHWKSILSIRESGKTGPGIVYQGLFPKGKQEISVSFRMKHHGELFFQQPIPLLWDRPWVTLAEPPSTLVLDSPMLIQPPHHLNQENSLIAYTLVLPPGTRMEFTLSGIPHPARWPKWLAAGIAGVILLVFGYILFRKQATSSIKKEM